MIPEPHSPVTPVDATAASKPGSSLHGSTPITLTRASQRLRVDAHALDGAGRRPLSAADLGAFERRSGRARRGELPVAIAEHDLGVGADVDDEPHSSLRCGPSASTIAAASAPT